MKHNLLFLFITIACFTYSSYAQMNSYGMRIGANYSTLSADNIPEEFDESRIGVAVGFFAEIPLNENLSLQPELQYSAQGNKQENFRINYLQAPIVFKYELNRLLNIQLGPQVGVKIWEWEDRNNYKTFDFAAVAGIGVNITKNIFVDLRYAHGLSNVIEEENFASIKDGNNRNIQLSIGYKI
ncbi:porin family protein [Aquimarina intermedia]|uniref:Outer membrane protein with beta-barrel domain n=1 Tax=Aquimarina intermedia TaxID=350814 RepID=A0A5S5C7C6_9FLAO|nr:porin family protein [Aquimarina intermedia]TYP75079.1 outer membrane protein with beta-barrel domain [Aquimarina intermedia]